MSEQRGCVLYVNGQSTPGVSAGWGVHGYTYVTEAEYLPGLGLKNIIASRYGYWDESQIESPPEATRDERQRVYKPVKIEQYIDIAGKLKHGTGPHQALLYALTNAVDCAIDQGVSEAQFLTDSPYLVDGWNTWMAQWVQLGYTRPDGQSIRHVALWKRLVELRDQLQANRCVVRVDRLLGNGSFIGGQRASARAGIGEGLVTEPVVAKRTPPGGYWKVKCTRHPFFFNNRWYFTSASYATGRGLQAEYVYYTGQSSEDEEFTGKPNSKSALAILYLKEPDPHLEEIRALQQGYDREDHNALIVGRLDHLFKPGFYSEYQRYGEHAVTQLPGQNSLEDHTGLALTRELRPPRLAYQFISAVDATEQVFRTLLYQQAAKNIAVQDITEALYEIGEKYKVRFPETDAVLTVPISRPGHAGTTYPIALTLGIELPKRATLNTLASRRPTVRIVTWPESQSAFRYAVWLTAGEDHAFLTSLYANIYLTLRREEVHDGGAGQKRRTVQKTAA